MTRKIETKHIFVCDSCKKEILNMAGGVAIYRFTLDNYRVLSEVLVHDPEKVRHFHFECWNVLVKNTSVII